MKTTDNRVLYIIGAFVIVLLVIWGFLSHYIHQKEIAEHTSYFETLKAYDGYTFSGAKVINNLNEINHDRAKGFKDNYSVTIVTPLETFTVRMEDVDEQLFKDIQHKQNSRYINPNGKYDVTVTDNIITFKYKQPNE